MSILQKDKENGGLALPNFRYYFLASQLSYFLGWGSTSTRSNEVYRSQGVETLPRVILESDWDLKEVWVPIGGLYIKVWDAIKDLLKIQGYTKYSPLWFGDNFPNLKELGEIIWVKYGIHFVSQLFEKGIF